MNSPNDDVLAVRLKRYRADAAMTQAKLADEADLSPAYISELESGSATRPSGQVLLQLAVALGVTIADLLGTAPQSPAQSPKISDSLREFAEERRLPEADIDMLASIRFRGERPRSARRWAFIYESILTSTRLDDEA